MSAVKTIRNRATGNPEDKNIVEYVGRHTSSPTSFGRLIEESGIYGKSGDPNYIEKTRALKKVSSTDTLQNILRWIKVLRGVDVPKKMALVDVFFDLWLNLEKAAGNTEVMSTPAEEARRLEWRPQWYDKQDDKDERGRRSRDTTVSRLPGIIPREHAEKGLYALQRAGVSNGGYGNYAANDYRGFEESTKQMFRTRGSDMYEMTAELQKDYKALLDNYNLNFSASASGTTSTLIAAAESFVIEIIKDKELFKEYIMACTAYLVGGGMHTCHEVFHTASIKGFCYVPGKYDSMLPKSFKNSPAYANWYNEFLDVLVSQRFH